MAQKHLNRTEAINLGSFYTPRLVVQKTYELLEKWLKPRDFTFLDSSCGYGDFFTKELKYIGADIDAVALSCVPKMVKTFHQNSLLSPSRDSLGIAPYEPLIIIGNPPYNDKTSLARSGIKSEFYSVDERLKYRDIGISFLRSYDILRADFVCVLHPLSYLIKKTNFNALKGFRENYRLRDSLVISSEIFTPKSSTFFPIVIAIYERDSQGMDFNFIQNYPFAIEGGSVLCLRDFDFIGSYVPKYPNARNPREAIGYFHTLRDINALKRNRTFLPSSGANAIKIFPENLKYYHYIHHFKKFATTLPYYLGNLDIFINHEKFLEISDEFFYSTATPKVEQYFQELYKEYV